MALGTHHSLLELHAGDDWEIRARLIDEYGMPYEGGSLSWLMYDATNTRVIDTTDYTITIDGGDAVIKVAKDKTETIGGGVYVDALRITIGGATNTILYGSILVVVDPWQLTAPVGGLLVAPAPPQEFVESWENPDADPYRKWP